MKKELFNELLESIREAGAIARGELEPASVTRFPAVDTRAIRESFGATQLEFSHMIGVSLATLRNWEQGRRMPQGPARILLLVVAKHPQVVRRVIAEYRAAAMTESSSGPMTCPARVAECDNSRYAFTSTALPGATVRRTPPPSRRPSGPAPRNTASRRQRRGRPVAR